MCSGVLRLPKEKEKPLYVQLAERDDLFDSLGLIPKWVWGAIIWFLFTKFALDKLTDKKPGSEINAAILASDVAGVTFPPGVALAAQVDVTLAAIGFFDDLRKFLEEGHERGGPGKVPAETALGLGQELIKGMTAGFLLITGLGRK